MAHISSIGSGMFSDLSVCRELPVTVPTTEAGWKALFAVELANGAAATAATGEFTRIKNIHEFPAIGTPPQVVNVPVYGQKSSQQIQAQSDAPSMELTLNFVGSDWQEAANYLGMMVGDGNQYAFRFTLLNAEPASYESTVAGLGTAKGGAAGTPACANSQYFWIGKLDALMVNPQLNDANTATLTITIQSAFEGAYTS